MVRCLGARDDLELWGLGGLGRECTRPAREKIIIKV
jgi:hypothetical protein